MRTYNVYILANHSRAFYIGMTSDLRVRMYEHKNGLTPGFALRLNINRLVYFESTFDVRAAIAREKQLKRWPRARKFKLIETTNASWNDLSVGWLK
ncbi:MAG: excinuclease subunit putative endonuclease [Gemmatimonadetes bacterium]|nr:excinuclease subunit putative endonuclease [Gemmatimonadota bacterium]